MPMDSPSRPASSAANPKETLPGQPAPFRGGGDPWAAFGYLVAGVAVYGAIGYGFGAWLHARFLTAVGVVLGAALGLYLVIRQFGPGAPPPVAEPHLGRPGPRPGDATQQVVPPQPTQVDTPTDREGRGEPVE